MPDQFTVSITNLVFGGQLCCSNSIEVSYTQPDDAGQSTVTLTTNADGAAISPPSFPVTNTSGTVNFDLSFSEATQQSGKTVIATIMNNEIVKNTDQKNDISVSCSGSGSGSGSG